MSDILLVLLCGTLCLPLVSCGGEGPGAPPPVNSERTPVTFIEIGSDHCDPCLQMRPVMDSIARKYGEKQITVLFYDVYKDKEKADPYRIQVMATQVFLNDLGVEFHRHEGFYPQERIDSLLVSHGLIPYPPTDPPRK